MKNIQNGEEITLSYVVNSWQSQSNRREELSYWQFQCHCQVCSLTGKDLIDNEKVKKKIVENSSEVDKFVETLKELQDNIRNMSEDDRRLLRCQIFVNIPEVLKE